jgi:hypothetical protein
VMSFYSGDKDVHRFCCGHRAGKLGQCKYVAVIPTPVKSK